jgi:hypothetical protein
VSPHNRKASGRRLKRLPAAAAVVMATVTGTASAAGLPRSYAVTARAGWQREVTAIANGAPVLGGISSRGWPISLVISPNGKRIEIVVMGLGMTCSSGGSFAVSTGFRNVPIRANGNVHARKTIPPFNDGSGVSITGGFRSISAHLNRKRWTFAGVWREHVDFATSSGQTDHCDSGNVSFFARL